MIKKLVFILPLVLLGVSLNAQIILTEEAESGNEKDSVILEDQNLQDNTTNEATAGQVLNVDTVYMHDGTILKVDVKKIYLNDLYYSTPGETKVNKIDQRLVHKIIYSSGKIEILNENAPDVRDVGDYRKVKVTKDPGDVEGLVEVAKLEAVAEGSDRGYSTPKSLERTATIVLRKKAALVNADFVLITDKKVNVAFGEIPSVTLQGTAYSFK